MQDVLEAAVALGDHINYGRAVVWFSVLCLFLANLALWAFSFCCRKRRRTKPILSFVVTVVPFVVFQFVSAFFVEFEDGAVFFMLGAACVHIVFTMAGLFSKRNQPKG